MLGLELRQALIGSALVALTAASCGGAAADTEADHPQIDPASRAGGPDAGADGASSAPGSAGEAVGPSAAGWASASRSPEPPSSVSAQDDALYRRCGRADLALMRVASAIVDRRLDGVEPPTPRELALLLRAEGVPQVWPRAWAVTGVRDEPELVRRLTAWAEREPSRGQARCGIARGADHRGEPIVAAVRVDALADLQPLPIQARLSEWLTLEARMIAPSDGAHVLLLGPRGRPRKVLASLSGGTIRSRFSLDQPGGWVVQVLATTATGPEPVLEARVFAGVEPAAPLDEPPTPGMSGADEGSPTGAEARLLRLLNVARGTERLPTLRRDPALDELARAHARRMASVRRLAHDLGKGTVEQRLVAANLRAAEVGENVAAARSVERAHQTLWASPSHRDNILRHGFRRVGIGVVSDGQHTLWVTQIFTE